MAEAFTRQIIKRDGGFVLTFNGTMLVQVGDEPHLVWPKVGDLVAALKRKGYAVKKDGTAVLVEKGDVK